MLSSKIGRRTGLGLVVMVFTLAFLAPVALSAKSANTAAPKVVGNPAKGKAVFTSTCGICHVLKAAKSTGAIGPNLDTTGPKLTEATIIKAVTSGGAAVMTKAQLAKYSTEMSAYKGTLSATQINDVSAFIYTSTHK